MTADHDDAIVAAAMALGHARRAALEALELGAAHQVAAEALERLRVAAEEYGRIVAPNVRRPEWAVTFAETLVNETIEAARRASRGPGLKP